MAIRPADESVNAGIYNGASVDPLPDQGDPGTENPGH